MAKRTALIWRDGQALLLLLLFFDEATYKHVNDSKVDHDADKIYFQDTALTGREMFREKCR